MPDIPLKILMTDPHLRGGGQVRYLTNLARELVQAGHNVTLGCRPSSVLIDSARQAGCGVCPEFPFRGGLRPRQWSRDFRRIQRFIHEEQPDIIHANLSQDHWACAVTNRLMGFPACLIRTRHNTYPVRESYANKVLNTRWTDFQIVVCEAVRKTLASQPVFEERRLLSIHNGVNAKAFRPNSEARMSIREEFGYTNGHLVLGIAARLVPAKGHVFLFEALAGLKEDFPSLRVLVLGEGELRNELEGMAAMLGIAQRVSFAGFRTDMDRCVQAIDIGIQPSIDCDTSSLSLKEQMAAEKPVIASDYGGLGEIVSEGIEGHVVPAGTVDPLARAIAGLARDEGMRGTMGKAGRERVLREFTVEVFARRTVEAYRRALEMHRERMGTRKN